MNGKLAKEARNNRATSAKLPRNERKNCRKNLIIYEITICYQKEEIFRQILPLKWEKSGKLPGKKREISAKLPAAGAK
jgi:hypothetical protein